MRRHRRTIPGNPCLDGEGGALLHARVTGPHVNTNSIWKQHQRRCINRLPRRFTRDDGQNDKHQRRSAGVYAAAAQLLAWHDDVDIDIGRAPGHVGHERRRQDWRGLTRTRLHDVNRRHQPVVERGDSLFDEPRDPGI